MRRSVQEAVEFFLGSKERCGYLVCNGWCNCWWCNMGREVIIVADEVLQEEGNAIYNPHPPTSSLTLPGARNV